ncbi:isoprenyl transferase [Liquorilactobacillus satsumensis]|uniref:isoprenyl transferase n=1 Tax=Liquorilactobacillus satsumensis TaxID=259059 RepID=UPI001E50763E|nr:isoprenyl transferase [Liquorilactobacillus satsumensis]MCC7665886.1 isoprenyl transferase [Liquorilactobacillus satsumensis]
MFSKFINNNRSVSKQLDELDPKRIPNHIAIIMDGNGRWAQKRHLPRIAGHKAALTTVKKVTVAASDLGVKVLTLYTFSTENWKRPKKEVDFLMTLPINFFDTFVPDLIKNNIQVRTIGELTALPQETRKAVARACEQTAKNDGMILNFAINYGGRAELVAAAQTLAASAVKGELEPTQITEKDFAHALTTAKFDAYADPDLLIRTSGEERISNFLLWQIAYSEFVFTDVLWPDYTPQTLWENIYEYQNRNRRFGGLKKE